MKNKPEFIIIHHSHTPDGKTLSWEAIRKYHMETNGWYDIGYHRGVELVGDKVVILKGRPDDVSGAHVKELHINSRSIGICVVGNYDEEKPDWAHLNALKEICHVYMINYNIPVSKVLGHREVGRLAGFDWEKGQYKSCPGKLFDMNEFRKFLVTLA